MSDEPDIERLEREVLAAAARVHAAQAELVAVLGRFTAAGGGQGAGIRSIGHWADINLGVPSRTASTMARAADALDSLPKLREAFAEGALSLDKVLTVAAVATAESDEKFTTIARAASVAQLSRICREYRRIDGPAETEGAEDRRACRRGVRVRRLDDQFVEILAVLDPDEAAIVLAAIDARVEEAWRAERGPDADVDEERPPTDHAARQADAFVELATEGLVGGPDPVVGGERIEVRVNVDADVLSGAREDGVCCIDGIGAVSPAVVRRLACDATVRAVIEVAPGSFELGRAQRMPNRRQRRSLRRRDKGCRYPGCWRQRFVQAHHAVPWEAGGCTDIDNLLLLCHEHHRLFHEGGYRIDVEGEGRFTFRRPDGAVIAPPPLRAEARGGPPPPGSPRATDGGARFDLDLTITALGD